MREKESSNRLCTRRSPSRAGLCPSARVIGVQSLNPARGPIADDEEGIVLRLVDRLPELRCDLPSPMLHIQALALAPNQH